MAFDRETIKAYIFEQQRFHDELTSAYGSLKTKIATYIGAILGFLAFLYVGALDETKTTLQKLFIPEELYGIIFYIIGLFFLLYALGILIHGARPTGLWHVALDSADKTAVESKAEKTYLIKLKNDYDDAKKSNAHEYKKKHIALKDSFYPMLMGAIIMIVLRYFQ